MRKEKKKEQASTICREDREKMTNNPRWHTRSSILRTPLTFESIINGKTNRMKENTEV